MRSLSPSEPVDSLSLCETSDTPRRANDANVYYLVKQAEFTLINNLVSLLQAEIAVSSILGRSSDSHPSSVSSIA